MNRKGQMFLIAAFIIAASIVSLRLLIRVPTIQEETNLLKITLEHDMANNWIQEIENSAKFSINEKTNITTNVFDFANFTERKAYQCGLEFKFLFVGSLANHSSSILNVSMINMLNSPINASLNLNGTSQTNEIVDNGKWDTYFSFNPGSSYVLTVGYNSTYSENVTIKTKNNKDVYVGFFDISFESSGTVYRNKAQETYNLK
jgi:hypothetical protein